MRLLMAGCVTCSLSAAAEKDLPSEKSDCESGVALVTQNDLTRARRGGLTADSRGDQFDFSPGFEERFDVF
jgi:hypothetical protein